MTVDAKSLVGFFQFGQHMKRFIEVSFQNPRRYYVFLSIPVWLAAKQITTIPPVV